MKKLILLLSLSFVLSAQIQYADNSNIPRLEKTENSVILVVDEKPCLILGVAAKALYAFSHYKAIGFSPFSIESTLIPITNFSAKHRSC